MTVGCGRISFDATTGDAGEISDGESDSARPQFKVTFGETGTETFSGVTADTSISNAGPATDNYGATDYMLVQAASAAVSLIHFDISAIPAGSTIVKASLRLWMVGGGPGGVTAYPMLEDWIEGTSDGTTGVASYNERIPGTAWSGTGATVPSHDPIASGTSAFVDTATPCDIELTTDVIQLWHDMPSRNAGLALLGTSVNTDVATRENPTLSARPVLSITYAN